ncbi:unnamed protein product [Mycena citricolor]|uniref:Agmatinase n=1 Tax=Mycena citricolor TaxID=2018698 RepID=A0AAD2GZG6_9AGAR|nr:unnamed protein product [Mycena citricolor]
MITTDGPGRLHHGSYFTIAHEEGLLSNTSIHGGIRQHASAGISAPALDLTFVQKERSIIPHDESLGFAVITTEDLDDYGLEAVVRTIRRRVGNTPVYLSLDIDTIDPGMAPATGTPVDGGWSTREMKRILRGLSGLNFVGCDVVEVSPAYDLAEITSRAAAGFVNDFLQMMQMETPPKPHSGPFLE